MRSHLPLAPARRRLSARRAREDFAQTHLVGRSLLMDACICYSARVHMAAARHRLLLPSCGQRGHTRAPHRCTAKVLPTLRKPSWLTVISIDTTLEGTGERGGPWDGGRGPPSLYNGAASRWQQQQDPGDAAAQRGGTAQQSKAQRRRPWVRGAAGRVGGRAGKQGYRKRPCARPSARRGWPGARSAAGRAKGKRPGGEGLPEAAIGAPVGALLPLQRHLAAVGGGG